MPIPADLPQPVRIHPAHQLPTNGAGMESPGPQAYEGYGVTQFDRDHRLGVFASARDRKLGPTGGPSSARSTSAGTQRSRSAQGTTSAPGPKYDVIYKPPTKLGTAFTRAERFKADEKVRSEGPPGPGSYFDLDKSSTIDRRPISSAAGTFPKARRLPLSKAGDSPSSADYSPNVAPTRIHHGPSSFPIASVKHRNATSAKKCETSEAMLAGHDELEKADGVVRPVRRVVSIGNSKRFEDVVRPSSGEIGPGEYDAVNASRRLAKQPIAVGFTMGTRHARSTHREMDPDIAAVGGGPGPILLPSTLSTKGVRISPPRSQQQQQRRPASAASRSGGGGGSLSPHGHYVITDPGGPGAYSPDVRLVKPSRYGVSFTRSERFSRPGSTAGREAEILILPTTLDTQHGVKMGSAKRFTLSAEEREWFSHPSAAEYQPKLPKRSSSRSILNRHEKVGQLMKEARETPGPKYDEVDLNLLREPLAKPVSFPKADRGLNKSRDTGVPGPGQYDAVAAHSVLYKKGGSGAMLYLGS